ncbi:MAG: lipid-A-disaccharide synthase [Gammaproteobacteria bacterium]|nr:lipid-A-disaccharide synthase [Gammaproteobacteria bacterium]
MPTAKPLKIGLIAGEHSGDILGADLIRALKLQHPDAIFYGIGGARMRAEGFQAIFDMEELAVMGIVEVLGRLPRLLQVRKEILQHFYNDRPDVFVGIDAPDFNLPVELKLKNAGIKTVHYVSPSVWAWRHKRIFKIAKATNLVLSLLPFEKAFYDKYQVPCQFVGHTLADQMPLYPEKSVEKVALGFAAERPLLALMPGSRSNEIKLLAPGFFAAAAQLLAEQPDLQLVCNMVTPEKAALYQKIKAELAPDLPITLLIGQARATLTSADAVFIASGTATLEAMLAKTPMVVAYKTNWLTFQIAKRMVKLQHVSLPNLLANQALVTELLQDAATPEALVAAMRPLLQADASAVSAEFLNIHQQLRCDASSQAANAILELIA